MAQAVYKETIPVDVTPEKDMYWSRAILNFIPMNVSGATVLVFLVALCLLPSIAKASTSDPASYYIRTYDYYDAYGGLEFVSSVPHIHDADTVTITYGDTSSMDMVGPAEANYLVAEMYYIDGGVRHFEDEFYYEYFYQPPYTWTKAGQYEVDIFGMVGSSTVQTYLTTMHFTVNISGGPTPTCSLTATPSTIDPKQGQSALLEWSSTDTSQVSIDQGIGSVATSGSLIVSPDATTTYTGTFTGKGGTVTCSTTLNIPDPVIRPLNERAAMLAKQLVNHLAYLWGGKGWDYDLREFTTPDRILSGYTYYDPDTSTKQTGVGVDCSGLVTWAFNRANDPTFGFASNYVQYVNADGMFRDFQSDPVSEADLRPGDTLTFDWNGDGHMDHVAMYVGDSGGYDVVNAGSERTGITEESASVYTVLGGFAGFRRVHQADVGLVVKTGSPVNMEVTDPDGYTITATSTMSSDEEYVREIPGELYYLEEEQGHDGRPQDFVIAPKAKDGEYTIKVIPEAGTDPAATYSLSVEINGSTTVVVDNETIDTIPPNGFTLKLASGEIQGLDPTIKLLLGDLYQTIDGWSLSSDQRKRNLLSTVDSALHWFDRNRTDQIVRKLTKLQNDIDRHVAGELSVEQLTDVHAQISDLLVLLNS